MVTGGAVTSLCRILGEIGSLEQGLRQNRLRLSSMLIAPLMKDDHTVGLKALVQDLVQCLPIAEVPTWKCGDEAKSDDYARRNARPFDAQYIEARSSRLSRKATKLPLMTTHSS